MKPIYAAIAALTTVCLNATAFAGGIATYGTYYSTNSPGKAYCMTMVGEVDGNATAVLVEADMDSISPVGSYPYPCPKLAGSSELKFYGPLKKQTNGSLLFAGIYQPAHGAVAFNNQLEYYVYHPENAITATGATWYRDISIGAIVDHYSGGTQTRVFNFATAIDSVHTSGVYYSTKTPGKAYCMDMDGQVGGLALANLVEADMSQISPAGTHPNPCPVLAGATANQFYGPLEKQSNGSLLFKGVFQPVHGAVYVNNVLEYFIYHPEFSVTATGATWYSDVKKGAIIDHYSGGTNTLVTHY